MSYKIKNFILGVYLSISVLVVGYFYINAGLKKQFPIEKIGLYEKYHINYLDFTNLKYSVVISIAGFILLFSILSLIEKKQ